MKHKKAVTLALFFCAISRAPYANITYIKDYGEIKKYLPSYTSKDLDGLIFRRQGTSPESFMEALGLHQVFKEQKAYRLSKEGLIASDDLRNAKKVPDDFKRSMVKPKSIIIEGNWVNAMARAAANFDKTSNILGGNGRLFIDIAGREVNLPLEEARSETLAYYGAVAIPLGEKVVFPSEEAGYPIWLMSLGTTYTKDYIMSEKAGGWYLEWHQDRPHFHMPLAKDAGGFYILGKALSETRFELTAFRIPYGVAVFTKRGAIHSDSGLTGKRWAVGYTTSKHYSTALLRNRKNEYIELSAK